MAIGGVVVAALMVVDGLALAWAVNDYQPSTIWGSGAHGNGYQLWGGTEGDTGYSVAVAADGTVYLAGYTDSFDAGSSHAFLVKYDTAGKQMWNTTSFHGGYGVAVATDGSVYLAGHNSGALLAKYNAAGTKLWDRSWGPSEASGYGVAADGSVYLAGFTLSYGAGGRDALLVKYDTTMMTTRVVVIIVSEIVVVVAVVVIAKRRVIAGHVKSARETLAARRNVPGKVEEVLYRGLGAGATNQVNRGSARNAIQATCSSCGQPLPKGAERGLFCVFCGKSLV